MKSSITTTSLVLPFWSETPAPSALFPLVIRTRETTFVGKLTPRNENVSLPTVAGTKNVPSVAFAWSKNWIEVVLARSTSLKTAPNPRTSAGVVVPGTKKFTSTTFDPRPVKRRWGVNGANVFGYEGSRLPNSTGATPAFALTWKPVPGVEKTAPRGLLTLKKLAGRLFGAATLSGTPSQLISRRAPVPSLNRPFAPAAVPPPRSVRKASRAGVIEAAVVPVPDSITSAKAGEAATASPASPTASTVAREMARKARIIGNPRRLIAVDWDGTITEKDILQPIAYEFGDPEIVSALDQALDEGTVTLRDEIVGEYATVRAPLQDVVAWASER